jgi:hypothetical protein
MASTKRSALARGFTVDTTALHQYNTTNFVEYASFEQQASSSKAASLKPRALQVASSKLQAPSSKHQAASREQQAPRFYCPHKDTRVQKRGTLLKK